MFCILIYYINHVNEISYFLNRCQMYKKTLFGSQPKYFLWKKSKHVAVMNFLIIF